MAQETRSSGSHRVHCIAEYLKRARGFAFEEFPWDSLDYEEAVPVLLGQFGVKQRMPAWEVDLLKHELKNLAERSEFAEIARLTGTENAPQIVLKRGGELI